MHASSLESTHGEEHSISYCEYQQVSAEKVNQSQLLHRLWRDETGCFLCSSGTSFQTENWWKKWKQKLLHEYCFLAPGSPEKCFQNLCLLQKEPKTYIIKGTWGRKVKFNSNLKVKWHAGLNTINQNCAN